MTGLRKSNILLVALLLVVQYFYCAPPPLLTPPKKIPLTRALIDNYKISDTHLTQLNYYLSYNLLLKKGISNSSYTISDDGVLNLDDARQDTVVIIKSNWQGRACSAEKVKQLSWKIWKDKKIYSMCLNFLSQNDSLVFIENESGYFVLERDDKGRIKFDNQIYSCIDGCNNILMVDAREIDYYRGTSNIR
ncbi:hypothetical protein EH223_17315 [candidate division KSB1 bacterium]|nr:hypothetical protein [candidate division KSB1 bacterium]RQW00907.1 MAG: hypothetical protein EH223_17315 [candidate division KSB1 bacterium]